MWIICFFRLANFARPVVISRSPDGGTQPQHGTEDAMTTAPSAKYQTPQQRREYIASCLRTKVCHKLKMVLLEVVYTLIQSALCIERNLYLNRRLVVMTLRA
jgi:hypothetical protein